MTDYDYAAVKDAAGTPALHSWHGAGWYTMRQWDDERAGFTSPEAPDAFWYERDDDFCEAFAACAGGLDNDAPAYGVEVGFHGHDVFPDDDVDVAPGYGDFDYEVWSVIRSMDERPMAYATIRDVVDYEVAPSLEGPEGYDVIEIARECWHFVEGHGYLQAVDVDEFWESAMRHHGVEEA